MGHTRRFRKRSFKKQNGGSTKKLPVPPTLAEFKATWENHYIAGHGISTGSVFVLPKNTYVLFLATSGCACPGNLDYVEDKLFRSDDTSPAKDDAMLESLRKDLQDGTLLSAKPSRKNLARMYRDTKPNIGSMYANVSGTNTYKSYTRQTRNVLQRTVAFYESGDIVQNILFSMMNTESPLFIQGVYQIPIDNEIKAQIERGNQAFEQFKLRFHGALPSTQYYSKHLQTKLNATASIADKEQYEMHEAEYKKLIKQEHLDHFLYDMHKRFFDVPSNEIRDIMFSSPNKSDYENNASIFLHQIINSVTRKNPDKINLFIVGACRSDCAGDISRARLGRRLSIASRRKDPINDRLNIDILMPVINNIVQKITMQIASISTNKANFISKLETKLQEEIPTINTLVNGGIVNIKALFDEIRKINKKGYLKIKPNSRLHSLLINNNISVTPPVPSGACGGGSGAPCVPVPSGACGGGSGAPCAPVPSGACGGGSGAPCNTLNQSPAPISLNVETQKGNIIIMLKDIKTQLVSVTATIINEDLKDENQYTISTIDPLIREIQTKSDINIVNNIVRKQKKLIINSLKANKIKVPDYLNTL